MIILRTSLCLLLLVVTGHSQDLPGFGALPRLEKNWEMLTEGTEKSGGSSFSWIVFTEAKTGDLLSFASRKFTKLKDFPDVDANGAWASATTDTLPNGYPMLMAESGDPDARLSSLRCRVVSIGFARDGENHKQDAIEYTNIYEPRDGGNLMAHGYGMALGPSQVFVQHTSAKPITAEFVNGIAIELVASHVKRRDVVKPRWDEISREAAEIEVLKMEPVPLKPGEGKETWLRVPDELMKRRMSIFMPTERSNGVSDYKVTKSGWLLVACNYDYQGNDSGNWRETQWMPEDFKDHGWVELTAKDLGGVLVSSDNREQVVFAKKVKAGESGRLRSNKYDPPFFIVCGQ